ncbi:MAG: DNA polymerase III subunit beta [Pseudomonadota bacterium]
MALDIIVPTKDLIRALSLASSVIEKRGTLPILGHFKIETKGTNIAITATDSDLELVQEVPAHIKEAGALTVPAITFSEIIRKIPDAEVSLQFLEAESRLNIHSKNCSFNISTLDAEDFPIMEDIGSSSCIDLSASALSALLEHTKYAMSTEETRYNLTGIYLHSDANDPNALIAAATDCHRLAMASAKIEQNLPQFGIILPSKTVHELIKIVKDPNISNGNLEMHIGSNKVRFALGAITFTSKIIDGSFPEYHAFIPVGNERKIRIQAKELADAIDRVATVTVEKFRAVKIVCTSTSIEIHASGAAKGEAHEVIMMNSTGGEPSYSGPDMSIGFNPRYILDALHSISSSVITLELNDASSPILIRADDAPSVHFVVMPVNV